MKNLIDFFTFQDPNVVYVILGMIFINSSSALMGTFAFLRKRSLIGDAVAHSLLPGICIGFMFAGEKNPFFLLTGALLSGWISIYLIDYLVNQSRIKQDTAIGLVLSVFFAFGIVLLTHIQNTGSGKQAGLDHFLFGQAAAISRNEIFLFAIIFLIILGCILLFYRSLVLISFNPEYAKSIGLPVKSMEFLLTTMTVLAVAAGIQALGVILISALVVTPAATARLWTHHLKKLLVLATTFSIFSGIAGAYLSYTKSGMPTGPYVILILSAITLFSISFAPKRGFVSRYFIRLKNAKKINDENILKAIYSICEKEDKSAGFNLLQILSLRNFDTTALNRGINRLIKKGYITKKDDHFTLSIEGKKESERIVKLHRMWEQYLLKRTQIDTDHVHSGAEAIEHLITPEIEKELERELGISGIPEDDY